jgi:hypothetical protein
MIMSAIPSSLRMAPAQEKCLKLFNDNIQFPALNKPFDPHVFFQTRDGLWVSDKFRGTILPKAKPIEELGATTSKSFDLVKVAYDRDIKLELPEGYIFDESELCAFIAQKIERQPKGGQGDLLKNGDWNIFYAAADVVGVSLDPASCEWCVYAWRFAGDWDAGQRVFSRN